jgi:D-alanyl-D-alanine carboxypeptidase (penicillin-binding protein 5/6)
MFLEVAKSVNYKELITGISVVSANDGCIALSEHLYGSEEAFVEEMNKRAKEIGLTKTHFVNSTGLPADGHVMSARDIAALAKHLMNKHPEILEIEKTREFKYNNINQQNRNPLLGTFQGADGLKTGWTEEAGYCLVGTAKQGEARLISVVLNTKDVTQRLITSKELLNYGFKNFEFVNLKKAGDVVDEIEIKDGKVSSVSVKVDESIRAYIPVIRANDIKYVTVKDATVIQAPSAAGTKVGKLEARIDDQVIGSSTISTVEAAEKISILGRFFRWLSKLFT